MRIVNDTPFAVGWMPCRVAPPQPGLTVVVKGAFALQPDAPAQPLAERPLLAGDLFHGDDPEASLRYATDLVPHKPGLDITLVGHARAPEAWPVPALTVGFGVGGWHKRLSVFGDRYWLGRGRGARTTEPQAFTAMPLTYERAFGGPGVPENPLGRGASPRTGADGGEVWPLPNVVDPRAPMGQPGEVQPVAGFAPIARTWPQRRMTGTYDAAWLAERWPWFPDDFDWVHFSSAPPDQRRAVPLRGDEPLVMEHMHPDRAYYRARLPGLRARAWLHAGEADGSAGPMREVPLRLDTLWVDVDAQTLVLLWRGHVAVATPDAGELTEIVLGAEPLDEAPLPEAAYRAKLAAAEAADAAPVPAPDQPDPPPDAEGEGEAETDPELAAHLAKAFAEVRARCTALGVSSAFLDRMEAGEDPGTALAGFYAEMGVDADAAQAELDRVRARTRSKLEKLGLDPSLLDPVEAAADGVPQPEDGAAVAARVAEGTSLAGAKLGAMDLTGLNLAGAALAGAGLAGAKLCRARLAAADMGGAELSGADLQGADLAETDLSGADLTGAVLAGARLPGAILQDAILTAADLSGAELTGATLAGAELSRARLAGARLEGADLTDARLVETDLTEAQLGNATGERVRAARVRLAGAAAAGCRFAGADFTDGALAGAVLDGADLSDALLDRADFLRASLVEALLEGAHGESVCLAGADLTKARMGARVRLPAADLRQVTAPGAVLAGAQLAGAVLAYADMARADLSAADLTDADLYAADLREGRLNGVQAARARLAAADLFRADLEGTDLSDADLSACNAFEAEFLNVVVTRRTRLAGANLGRTKLAGFLAGA